MNQQDQQAIEELFQYLYKSAGQAGPRDPEAEALIQQRVQQAPPGLLYHMAQTLVAQRHTIQQAQAQLAAYQQQGGSPAGFGAPGPQGTGQPGYPAYGSPQYQQPGSYQQGYQPYQQGYQPPLGQPGHHGFLSGAGKLALGVGGGIVGVEALRGIFDGGLFGGDDRDRDQDFGFGDRDPGDGRFDDGGGFDGGGFDGNDGGDGGDGGW